MLDHISISHQGGIVLWSRSYTPQAASLVSSPASPVNVLVRDVLVSGRTTDSGEDVLESGGWKMEWTLENELGLVFVVAYHRLLHLSYIPTLLETLKTLFLSLYSPYLTSFVESVKGGVAPAAGEKAVEWDFKQAFEGWDGIFEKVLKKAEEGEAKTNKKPFSRAASSTPKKDLPVKREEAVVPPLSASTPSRPVVEEKPQDADEIAKNLQALKAKLKGSPAGAKKGGAGGGGSKAGSGAASPGGSSGAETPTKRTKSAGSKVMRKWGDSSSSITDSDMAALDFSSPPPPTSSLSPPADSANLDELVSKEAMGTRGKDGLYDVADLDAEEEDDDDEEGLDGLGAGKEDDVDAMINKALAKSRLKTAAAAAKSSSSLFKRSPLNPDADEDVAKASSSSSSTMSSFFSRLTGSKVLTKEDLAPVLEAMEKHLMGKNVAKEIAEKMCEGVEKSLVGKKLAGFGSVKAEVRTSLSQSITRILTPKSSTDILLEIKRKQQLHLSNLALSPTTTTTTTSSSSPTPTDPYKMVFIGVNGVGKSTNLSKVCFWLLQNGLRVLIAACDTFRSGAVEQLRVHVRNLGLLGDKATTGTDGEGEGKGKVELFERGYGKDSAGIAKEAIAYAKTNAFDVVLIDTAGRMQDNEPLMRALSKLVTVNQPDKIVFVGEALVGNEAVDQLSKFDRSLRDFTAAAAGNAGGKAGAGGGGKGGRGVDGMILTKFDTIDDKVGAALSMTYVTGQPILFVGCGQTYTDLRHLRVNHIVQALLKD